MGHDHGLQVVVVVMMMVIWLLLEAVEVLFLPS